MTAANQNPESMTHYTPEERASMDDFECRAWRMEIALAWTTICRDRLRDLIHEIDDERVDPETIADFFDAAMQVKAACEWLPIKYGDR